MSDVCFALEFLSDYIIIFFFSPKKLNEIEIFHFTWNEKNQKTVDRELVHKSQNLSYRCYF